MKDTLIVVIGCNKQQYTEFLQTQATPKIYHWFLEPIIGRGFNGILDLGHSNEYMNEDYFRQYIIPRLWTPDPGQFKHLIETLKRRLI